MTSPVDCSLNQKKILETCKAKGPSIKVDYNMYYHTLIELAMLYDAVMSFQSLNCLILMNWVTVVIYSCHMVNWDLFCYLVKHCAIVVQVSMVHFISLIILGKYLVPFNRAVSKAFKKSALPGTLSSSDTKFNNRS